MTSQVKPLSMEQRLDNIENWQKWLLRGFSISLAGALAFAFWLGTISNEVSNSRLMTQKVYAAVLEDPKSLTVRVASIEQQLTGVENRLTRVENRLDSIEKRLDKMESSFTNFEAKLDLLLSRGTSRVRR